MKILLVDDHALVRMGVKQLLSDEFTRATVAEARTGQDAVKVAGQGAWDLAIVDINLPDTSGLDVLKKLKALHPALPVVILSFHPEEQYALRVLKSGAAAYLSKDSLPKELARALRTVLAGRQYVTASMVNRLESASILPAGNKSLHATLSDRELEVLSMIGKGKSVTEIAAALDISAKTISTYRMRLLAKLQLKTTSALIRYALVHGL